MSSTDNATHREPDVVSFSLSFHHRDQLLIKDFSSGHFFNIKAEAISIQGLHRLHQKTRMIKSVTPFWVLLSVMLIFTNKKAEFKMGARSFREHWSSFITSLLVNFRIVKLLWLNYLTNVLTLCFLHCTCNRDASRNTEHVAGKGSRAAQRHRACHAVGFPAPGLPRLWFWNLSDTVILTPPPPPPPPGHFPVLGSSRFLENREWQEHHYLQIIQILHSSHFRKLGVNPRLWNNRDLSSERMWRRTVRQRGVY